MNNKTQSIKAISLFLAFSILLSSCASTTLITSIPTGAKVYLNNEPIGTTPYSHTDTKITGSTNYIQLKKEGYETFRTTFSRDEEVDVGAVVGGCFFLFPFIWTLKYKPTHTYELKPLEHTGNKEIIEQPQKTTQPKLESKPKVSNIKSKADRLRELKKLLDEEILTQEEFDKEKKKILEEED